MTYILIIRDEANEDMAQAYLYYEKIQKGLGERFISGDSEHYNAISENPKYFGFIDDNKTFRE